MCHTTRQRVFSLSLCNNNIEIKHIYITLLKRFHSILHKRICACVDVNARKWIWVWVRFYNNISKPRMCFCCFCLFAYINSSCLYKQNEKWNFTFLHSDLTALAFVDIRNALSHTLFNTKHIHLKPLGMHLWF